LLDKLDRNEIRISDYPEDYPVIIKQQIYLEVVLRLETLIESTLVLVASLEKGYTSLAHDMTHYDIGFVKDIARRFAKRECGINAEIKQTIQGLEFLIRYVCENHMIHAINCGENYVPYSRVKNAPHECDVNFLRKPDAFSTQQTDLILGIFKEIMGRKEMMDNMVLYNLMDKQLHTI
jgi:hypothetical protein